jgi:hypothetical protein
VDQKHRWICGGIKAGVQFFDGEPWVWQEVNGQHLSGISISAPDLFDVFIAGERSLYIGKMKE